MTVVAERDLDRLHNASRAPWLRYACSHQCRVKSDGGHERSDR